MRNSLANAKIPEMTGPQLSLMFFLQMGVILASCRLVGALARRLGQPQVVGEMIAGVLLGPSLLGWMLPGVQQLLFPPESLKILYVGAQLGVGLYMFLIGLEFDTEQFLERARSAAIVSLAGMVVPFLLGAGLALWLTRVPGMYSDSATPFEAMLFLGAALSITAFPMLARIIHERGLTGSSLGTLALAAGAIGDVAAWCVLAVVLASFGGGPILAVKAILGSMVYAALLLTVGKRLFRRLGRAADSTGKVSAPVLGTTLMLLLLSVSFTDYLGVHAVFGGFLMGLAMPRGVFAEQVKSQLEPFAVVFLLPMFFTFSGLNTRLDFIGDPQILAVAAVVLAAACIGKGGACWAAARLRGEDNRTALGVGTLMNARGLMELIIINIGLERGIIQPGMFAVLVMMAVITTVAATPVFEWVYGRHARARKLEPFPANADVGMV